MKVGIIGLGYVGASVRDLFAPVAEVVVWDIKSQAAYPTEELATCDFAVVSVDTPEGPSGAAHIVAVEDAVSRVPVHRVLLKSTVPPGTTERLAAETGKEICFWPEYIGESRYHNPYFPTSIAEVPFVILGGESKARGWFVDVLVTVLGPTKKYFQCTSREAEIIKYAENAYFATKITFVNEFRRISEAFGADWHTVREGWLLDPRIEPMHTAAFTDAPGFAGKCLPKDLRAIIAASRAEGYEPGFLEAVLRSNDEFRAALEYAADSPRV